MLFHAAANEQSRERLLQVLTLCLNPDSFWETIHSTSSIGVGMVRVRKKWAVWCVCGREVSSKGLTPIHRSEQIRLPLNWKAKKSQKEAEWEKVRQRMIQAVREIVRKRSRERESGREWKRHSLHLPSCMFRDVLDIRWTWIRYLARRDMKLLPRRAATSIIL